MTIEDIIGVNMRGQESQEGRSDAGYAMAALLVTLAVMTVLMSVAMPSWRHMVQREREAELIFRGEQYARAVGLFQRKFAGALPPSIDVLLDQKFLRKKYKDPMTADGEFQILYQSQYGPEDGSPVGAGPPPPETGGPSIPVGSQIGSPGMTPGTAGTQGISGVASKSTKTSIRLYKGRNAYNQWQFQYTEVSIQGGRGSRGAQPSPGATGGGGRQMPGGGESAPRPGAGTGGGPSPRMPGPPGSSQPFSPR